MNTQRHVLISDIDPAASADLAETIAAAGFLVTCVTSAAETMALAFSRTVRVDLLLLDTDLPDADGREVVSRLRRRGIGVPMLLMSNSSAEDDVVWGLEAGADDYLVRPLRPRELIARLNAQFRAAITRDEADVRIGPALFRPSSRTLLHPDVARPLRLTEKEASLLRRLCESDGRPVSRQTLLREVWGYSPDVSSHTVETHIYRLRRKLEPLAQSPALLVNEGGGYRLLMDAPLSAGVRTADNAQGWRPGMAHPPMLSAAAGLLLG